MKYEKLVRDRIPDIIRQEGREPVVRIAEQGEYGEKLREKLREELQEFLSSGDIAELVDLLEVIYAIGEDQGISQQALEDMRMKKREARGAFSKRIILEEA